MGVLAWVSSWGISDRVWISNSEIYLLFFHVLLKFMFRIILFSKMTIKTIASKKQLLLSLYIYKVSKLGKLSR